MTLYTVQVRKPKAKRYSRELRRGRLVRIGLGTLYDSPSSARRAWANFPHTFPMLYRIRRLPVSVRFLFPRRAPVARTLQR